MRYNFALACSSIALALAVGACASTGTPRPAGFSTTKITRSEIEATSASSAYDVITQLRPNWLHPAASAMTGVMATTQSGTTSVRVPLVLVYLDDVRLGGIEQLRSISASVVRSMEFLSATRAATVVRDIGTVAADAVIMVSTRE